jgi:hypothetical protein
VADRRKVMVALTSKAQELLLELSLTHRAELRRLAPLLQGLLRKFDQAERKHQAQRKR